MATSAAFATLSAAMSSLGEWEDRADFPPGPQLACALSDSRLTDLPDAELIEAMRAARRQTSWAQARELALIAELSRRRHAEDAHPDHPGILTAGESVIEEIAAGLTVTANTATTLLNTAERLSQDLPAVRTALETGRIDYARARIICDAITGIEPTLVPLVEAAVTDKAATQTTGQLRHRVKKVLQAVDPDAYQAHAQNKQRDRGLQIWDNPTGTSDLLLHDLATEQAHAIHNTITAIATALRNDGDPRTLNQLRADLATTLLHGTPLPQAAHTLLLATTDQQDPPHTTPHGDTTTHDTSHAPPHNSPLRPKSSDHTPAHKPPHATPSHDPSTHDQPTQNAPPRIPLPSRPAPASAAPPYDVPPQDAPPDHGVPQRGSPSNASAPDKAVPHALKRETAFPDRPPHPTPPRDAQPQGARPDHAPPHDALAHNASPQNVSPRNPAISGQLASAHSPRIGAHTSTTPSAPLDMHEPSEGGALALDPEGAGEALARLLGQVVDRRLQALLVIDRAAGRLDRLPSDVLAAVDALHAGLDPLRHAWCHAMRNSDLQHGRDGYRPSTAMRQLIEERHPRCVFPTCNQPSRRCDLDHTREYGTAGGSTCPCNLAPLCRRHHRLKQTPGWHLRQLWPGLLIWITPTGTWHLIAPPSRE
jgi:uncharacterized protein DUF222